MNGSKKPPAGRVTLALTPRYFELAAERGWKYKQDHAEHVGIHPTNMGEVLNGKQFPGRHVIAGILREFPDLHWRELFEIVPDEPASLRSAA